MVFWANAKSNFMFNYSNTTTAQIFQAFMDHLSLPSVSSYFLMKKNLLANVNAHHDFCSGTKFKSQPIYKGINVHFYKAEFLSFGHCFLSIKAFMAFLSCKATR